MNHLAHLSLFVALMATDPPAPPPAPKVDPIRLPVSPVPIPPPNPTAVGTLAADQIYAFDSDVPCIVLASPAGLVNVNQEAGPVKMRGKFAVDGTPGKKSETRTYAGKYVYTVEAAAAGRVELLIVPPVVDADNPVRRRSIDVTVGDPIPPPVPPTPPTPPKPPDAPVALWGFVLIEETAAAVAARGALLADPTLAAFLKTKTYHWRIVDKDVQDSTGKPPADVVPMLTASAGHPYPQIFIVDAKGVIVKQADLPNAAGVVALLKQFGG